MEIIVEVTEVTRKIERHELSRLDDFTENYSTVKKVMLKIRKMQTQVVFVLI